MNATIRNERAKQYVIDKIKFVSQLSDNYFEDLPDYVCLTAMLNDLIYVDAKGFRGIVATAITGKHLNPDYDPLNNFYACNPRSIFEQGIFYAFENIIPCGKSDPLNVAKNVNELNESWIQGKRPLKAAQAAVDYLRKIESSQGAEQEKLIDYFFYVLLKYANSVKKFETYTFSYQGTSNQLIASKLIDFTLSYPESGTTPQIVIFHLLNELYLNSSVKICGGKESVFGTNTTSKKPADLWISSEGNIINLFEITVKRIDYKRLDDAILSLNEIGLVDKPLQFICRLPTDIATLKGIEYNSVVYKGKSFDFLDISSFIRTISCLITPCQLNNIVKEMQNFVAKIDRKLSTKIGWNKIFSLNRINEE